MKHFVVKKKLEKQLSLKGTLNTTLIISNTLCPWTNVAQETQQRQKASRDHLLLLRTQLPLILQGLKGIPDYRNPKKIKHKLTVLMLYGLLMFIFQFSSRRQVNQEMSRPKFMENLTAFFPELDSLPHADTLYRVLKQIEVNQLEKIHIQVVNKLIRGKKFKHYLINNCYPIAIDGSQKLSRDQLFTEQLLQRKMSKNNKKENEIPLTDDKNDDYHYYIYVLEANLSFQNGLVIPLLSEFLEYQLGDQLNSKQDCELRAFKRLGNKIKRYFSHLPIMLLLDGLYANGPVMDYCEQKNWQYMIVLKEDDLKTIWREFKSLLTYQKTNTYQQSWGRREQSFTWVNDIEYEYDNARKRKPVHLVVCDEYWHEANEYGELEEKKSRHAWLSSRPIHDYNVHERCNLGARYRWGIEANFLVEKHQGYHYEHCFSFNWNAMKGYHYLMRLAHLFNALALFSVALAPVIHLLGKRGLLKLICSTLSAPWFAPSEIKELISQPFRLRLI